MTRLVATLVTAGTVMFAGAASAQHSEVIQRGEKVYAAQKCQMCHSIAGKGNQKGALDGVGTKLKPEELRLWIVDAPAMTAKAKATRKPLMKAYPNLPKEDVDALVTFLATLKKS
jgi:mono/diheme cytochrome c family protein